MSIVGLDLAGVETRPTGYCTLLNMETETSIVYFDAEITSKIRQIRPKVIAIDAPLSLPPGRKSLDERNGNHLRECDRELLKRGIKFFPITLGPMRKLTERGMRLKKILEAENLTVIETYLGGAQDVLGIARKQRGLEKLRAGLENLGLKGLNNRMSDHELDAVTCAYVGKLFLEKETVVYGCVSDGIVMPKGEKKKF
jgi:predicted nuclease with RNAse H fold